MEILKLFLNIKLKRLIQPINRDEGFHSHQENKTYFSIGVIEQSKRKYRQTTFTYKRQRKTFGLEGYKSSINFAALIFLFGKIIMPLIGFGQR